MSAALASMTGFSRVEGSDGTLGWAWELRSVNGRGLDVRFRLPPGFDAVEPEIRAAAQSRLRRGNVTATLAVQRDQQTRLTPEPAALEQVLALALALQTRIPGCPAPRAEALLALPGVLRSESSGLGGEPGREPDLAAIRDGFTRALDRLVAARRSEGARLAAVLGSLLADIAALCRQAASEAADQPALQQARLLENVQALMREIPKLPEERIAQEVALLVSRSDIREELDRLASHVQAARDLLEEGVAVGRRLDFLVQEFNREANTLCSKSASLALTATGLRLKAAIEQLREQAANIE